MKLGNTYYYRMARNGSISRDADFDSTAPCNAADKKCGANEIRVWTCTNWDNERVIAAGRNVRAKYPTDEAIAAALPE